jgi:hypothetical protein
MTDQTYGCPVGMELVARIRHSMRRGDHLGRLISSSFVDRSVLLGLAAMSRNVLRNGALA